MSLPLLTPAAVTHEIVTSVRKEANQLARNDWFEPILSYRWLDNRVVDWLVFLLLFALAYLVMKLVQRLLILRVANWAGHRGGWLGFVGQALRSLHPLFFMALALSFAGLVLHVSKPVAHVLQVLPVLAVLAQLSLLAQPLVSSLLENYIAKREDVSARLTLRTMFVPLQYVGTLILWSILGLMALDSLGFDITALIAGLGIGGVAVALAVQTILSDLLAAVSIALDKPFMVGDFIVVGDFLGTVEKIGLKTTRLRSLSGELLVFANSDLLGSRIRNYKTLKERRVVFTFDVQPETPLEKLQAIPGWVQSMIEAMADTRFDRAHLAKMDKNIPSYEVVYFILNEEYNVYMDRHQALLFNLMEHFQTEDIQFASLPAQAVALVSAPPVTLVEPDTKKSNV